MPPRQFPIEQIAPWLVSGASGWYIITRARKLSRAMPIDTPWPRFLAQQSDVLLLLCGGPAVWHLARRQHAGHHYRRANHGDRVGLAASISHRLRQVFTVLLLGLGIIARKAAEGKTDELLSLVRRLQHTTRAGARILAALDAPIEAAPSLDGAMAYPLAEANGRQL